MKRTLFFILLAVAPWFLFSAEVPKPLEGIQRIAFLGDSITQGGAYVTDFECWLLSRGLSIEVIGLGLSSETVSDTTKEENAGHKKSAGFGRPMVSERLTRTLEIAKPDLVIACYGMNDGSTLPAGEAGMARFRAAEESLRNTILKAGAKRVVVCTPPVHDPKTPGPDKHDDALTAYSFWLVGKKADGWDVVDIHSPMRLALDSRRQSEPSFRFAPDGTHPGREGHFLMAREILTQFLGANTDGVTQAEGFFKQNGPEIRKLVDARRGQFFAAYMTKIGHLRPGAPGGPGAKPGPSIEEATAAALETGKKIKALMEN